MIRHGPVWIACGAGLAGLVLSACGPDPVAPIEAEIGTLKSQRVERAAAEKARAETEETRRTLAAAEARNAEMRSTLAALEGRRAELDAAAAVESARTARLLQALSTAQRETRDEAIASAQLDTEIAAAQARARGVSEQAAAFAQEIRPGDATWATERRTRAAAEFLGRVARDYPDDPIVTGLATEAAAAQAASDAQAVARSAARLRDRFDAVYGLSPAVGAAPAASTGPAER